MHKIYH